MATKPTLTQIRDYFEFTSTAAFSAEWKRLTTDDKVDLKSGFENGSMSY